jgi:acyl-CoA thioester hydrolase
MDSPAQDAPRPFIGFEGRVERDWIDVNRHMNVAWYDHVFDTAESALFYAFGMGEAYISRHQHGMFRLEKRIRYEREAVEADLLRVESRITAFDQRVLRHTHVLINVTKGVRAGTAEYVSIHVDLSKRKSTRVTEPLLLGKLRGLTAEHSLLPPVEAR